MKKDKLQTVIETEWPIYPYPHPIITPSLLQVHNNKHQIRGYNTDIQHHPCCLQRVLTQSSPHDEQSK